MNKDIERFEMIVQMVNYLLDTDRFVLHDDKESSGLDVLDKPGILCYYIADWEFKEKDIDLIVTISEQLKVFIINE